MDFAIKAMNISIGAILVMGIFTWLVLIITETPPEDTCKQDCETLGHEYFKYTSTGGGLFSSGFSSCWCRDGDKSIQIW